MARKGLALGLGSERFEIVTAFTVMDLEETDDLRAWQIVDGYELFSYH